MNKFYSVVCALLVIVGGLVPRVLLADEDPPDCMVCSTASGDEYEQLHKPTGVKGPVVLLKRFPCGRTHGTDYICQYCGIKGAEGYTTGSKAWDKEHHEPKCCYCRSEKIHPKIIRYYKTACQSLTGSADCVNCFADDSQQGISITSGISYGHLGNKETLCQKCAIQAISQRYDKFKKLSVQEQCSILKQLAELSLSTADSIWGNTELAKIESFSETFKRHAPIIVPVSIVTAVAGYFGWQWWKTYRRNKKFDGVLHAGKASADRIMFAQCDAYIMDPIDRGIAAQCNAKQVAALAPTKALQKQLSDKIAAFDATLAQVYKLIKGKYVNDIRNGYVTPLQIAKKEPVVQALQECYEQLRKTIAACKKGSKKIKNVKAKSVLAKPKPAQTA